MILTLLIKMLKVLKHYLNRLENQKTQILIKNDEDLIIKFTQLSNRLRKCCF